ncbi:MAG: phosphatidate cytidylyltransferase [Bacteroidaceae bacterium]|nr:phosphatidate cytidylyltransferase [Bacteroidaceae bacterium]
MNLHSLIIRTLTGAIYVLLLVGCTVYSPVSAFFFFAVVAAATLWEFGTLMNIHLEARMPRPINAMAGVVLVAAVWLSAIASPQTAQMFALYGLLMLYILVSGLYRHSQKPLQDWALCFASQIYIALPFALLPLLSIVYDETASSMVYNWIYPLALFIFLWVNDTFAYLCGCSLQKYIPAKLFPRISPKKSWIGSIGGGLFTLLAALIISWWQPDTMPLLRWLGFALVVIVFGTWGDLVESLIKRQLGIKDSGHILPGHGGMLDRFDSALLVIPASVIYFILTSN